MTYNIFISHSWNYSDAFDRLKDLLDGYSYFSYADFSVPKDNPIHTQGSDARLYQAILNKMRPCHSILIMAGVYSSYSKWIDKEIRIAKTEFSNPKRIIGIRPWEIGRAHV